MVKLSIISLVVLLWADLAVARKAQKPAGKPAATSEKTIDFEGDVVEGLNRRPLDSLTATSEETNKLGMGHSYRRQKNFDEETHELSRDLAETY